MALLESSPTVGTSMPSFELPDVFGKVHSSTQYHDKDVLVVMFICGHCPYVQAIEERLVNLGTYFENQSVQFLGVCSNDAKDYPEDSPASLRKRVEYFQYSFPYLIDETQQVAQDFDAVCTPDIFVFNKERKLAYHGRVDDNWKNPDIVSKEELKEAIEHILENGTGPEDQVPSIGCSIKWKK